VEFNQMCSLDLLDAFVEANIGNEHSDHPDGPLDTTLPVSPDVVVLVELEGLREQDVWRWGVGRCYFRKEFQGVAGSLQLLRRDCD